MSVELDITSSGTVGDVINWSVTENATPVAIGDSSGSVGQISVTVEQGIDSEFIIDSSAVFTHEDLGSINGRVSDGTSNGASELTDTSFPLSIDTVLSSLATDRVAKSISRLSDVYKVNTAVYPYFDNLAMNPADGSLAAISGDQYMTYDASGNPTLPNTIVLSGGIYVNDFIIDTNDDLWVYDINSSTIRKYDSAGAYLGITISGHNNLSRMAVNSTHLFVTDPANSRIRVYLVSTGAYVTQWGTLGAGNGQFFNLGGIAVGDSITTFGPGSVYVVDGPQTTNFRVQKFDYSGTYITSWTFDTAGIEPSERFPYHSPVSADGNDMLWFTDLVTGTVYAHLAPTGERFAKMPLTFAKKTVSAFIRTETFASVGNATGFSTAENLYRFIGFTPTLSDAFSYYINLVDPNILVSYQASTNPTVIAKGWTGDVWKYLKDLCAAYNVEIALISDSIIIRDISTSVLPIEDALAGSTSLTLSTANSARTVNIKNYKSFYTPLGLAYSAFSEGKEISVDIGATVTYTTATNHDLTEVYAPIMLSDPGLVGKGTPGFVLYDAEGKLYPEAAWYNNPDYAGVYKVELDPTNSSNVVTTIVGPRSLLPGYPGPYRIVGGGFYGRGVFMEPEMINLYVGNAESTTPEEVAKDIDNIFIKSLSQVYDRGSWASEQVLSPQVKLSFSIPTTQVQSFGLTQGSRFLFKEAIYRVIDVTLSKSTVKIDAVRHTTQADVVAVIGSATMGDYVNVWGDHPAKDVLIKPLRTIL